MMKQSTRLKKKKISEFKIAEPEEMLRQSDNGTGI